MGGISSKNSFEAKHCTPLGLYECEWDKKTLKKLICDKKLAPITKGSDVEAEGLDECPICFLFYPCGLNRARCCNQEICSECALQIKKPSTPHPTCPFCNAKNFTTVFRGAKSVKERAVEEAERQKVLEAKSRILREQMEQDKARAEQRRQEDQQRAAEEADQSKNEQEDVDNAEEERRGEEPQAMPSSIVASHEANDESHFVNYPPPANQIPDDAFGVGSPSFDFSGYDGPPEELEEWMVRVAMRMSLAQQL